MQENYFEIGKIVNTQGIKGDVRVIPTTDDITRFELLTSITVRFAAENNSPPPAGWTRSGRGGTYTIERVWYHKNFVILKLLGIDDMTSAERLKGGVIVIPPELALPLSENEYYIRDLLDMTVTTANGEHLGVITDVLETGANDVFVVKPDKSKEILIPHIKQCVLSVDIPNKIMTVELLEGLRD